MDEKSDEFRQHMFIILFALLSNILFTSGLQSRLYGITQQEQVSFNISFENVESINVYYDFHIHGLEFVYSNNTVKSVGYKIGQQASVSLLVKELRIFKVNFRELLDVIQFCFSKNDCTKQFGSKLYDKFNSEFNLDNFGQNHVITGLSGSFIDSTKALNTILVTYEKTTSCRVILTNLNDNDSFNHKTVIFNGDVWNVENKTIRSISVMNLNYESYSKVIDIEWPVNIYNQFKGLIKLQKGNNKIVFTYDEKSSGVKCSTAINLRYEEDLTNDPLHLVIIAAKDSELVYDVEPGEVNDIESAKWKYRTMAWLWQSYTDHQIYKFGLGRRCFRLDEAELINGEYYPKVNVLRSELTLKEIRDPNKSDDAFFIPNVCVETVKNSTIFLNHNSTSPLQVSCLFIDSKKIWNSSIVLAYDVRSSSWALNGGINFGTYGSHLLFAIPKNLKEMSSKFNDIRSINTNYTANEGTYRGGAASVGMADPLHELGYSFGLMYNGHAYKSPNYGLKENNGLVIFNRNFYSTELQRDKKWLSLKTNVDDVDGPFDGHYSIVDANIMIAHHLFRLKTDPKVNMLDRKVDLFATSSNSFSLHAESTIKLVAFYSENHTTYPHYLAFSSPSKLVNINMSESVNLMDYKNEKIDLVIILGNGNRVILNDIFNTLKDRIISDTVFKSKTFGSSYSFEDKFRVNFEIGNNVSMVSFKVYYDEYARGIDFIYSNGTVISVGYKIGNSTEVSLNDEKKEIRIVRVKSVTWIDTLQFCYSRDDCIKQFGGNDTINFDEEINLENLGSNYKLIGFTGASSAAYSTLNNFCVIYESICKGNNEEFSECGSACPLKCDKLDNMGACIKMCVRGCFCKEGFVRDSNNKCVRKDECQAKNIQNSTDKSLVLGPSYSFEDKFRVNLEIGDYVRMVSFKVYYDEYARGIDFIYSNGTVISVGYKIGNSTEVNLNGGKKEIRIVRAKYEAWIDALQICYSENDCIKQFGGNDVLEFDEKIDLDLYLDLLGFNYKITGFTGASVAAYSTLNKFGVLYKQIYKPISKPIYELCKKYVNEEYSDCGSACPLTCKNMNNRDGCFDIGCVIGCFCKPGFFRDNDYKCVRKYECPQMVCNGTNEVYRDSGNTCDQTCDQTCDNMDNDCVRTGQRGCYCKPGFVRDINNKCISSDQCTPLVCNRSNEVFKHCGNACQPTCKYPNGYICILPCKRGCFCNEGFVRDSNNNCIPQYQCSPRCIADNEEYSDYGSLCPEICDNVEKVCAKVYRPGCYCKPGFVRDSDNYCMPKDQCSSKVCTGNNEIFKERGTACPLTCKYPEPHICVAGLQNGWKSGCFCKPGYIRDDNNKCILPNECQSKINWQGYWANNCEFDGNDLTNVKAQPEHCSNKCAKTKGCTHFSWTDYEGGTCWLKQGPISSFTKAKARPQHKGNFICGLIKN